MEKENKKVFIAWAIAWALLAAAVPVGFIGWRYDLFRKAGELQLSGWGFIGVIIIFVFLHTLARYIKAGFVEWSMAKQILNGIVKVLIPLGALLAVCMSIRANIDYFVQALSMTMLCEAAAIPVNPFPEWVYKKSQGRFESMMDLFADKMKQKEGGK